MKEDPEISQALLEANPHIAALLFVFGLVIVLMLTGFLFFWAKTLARWYQGASILPVERWKPRAWGLADVALVLSSAIFLQATMIPAWAALSGINLHEMVKSESISLSLMAVGSLSYLVAMLMAVMWLFIRYSASAQHIGISLRGVVPHASVGLAAAAMTLPIVALISYAVSEGTKTEYNHPLIEELKKEGTVTAYLLAVFCAVVVAPLVEEFFFRVMLQGWLQSVPWSARSWWWLLGSQGNQTVVLLDRPVDAVVLQAANEEGSMVPNAIATQASAEPPLLANPSTSPVLTTELGMTSATLGGANSEALNLADDTKPPIWPSFVVGTLFGLAHYEYGLSFIPLIVLGTVLGLLYRAKHSIWPCFLLHFALNSFSMASLGISLLIESVK